MRCPIDGCNCSTTYRTAFIENGHMLCANNHVSEFSCKKCSDWLNDKIGCYNSNFMPNKDPKNPTCKDLTYQERRVKNE